MASEPTWFTIINPVAGRMRDRHFWLSASRHLNQIGIKTVEQHSQYPGHTVELVRKAIQEGFRFFLIAGGDGTVNEALNGLMSQAECRPLDCIFSHIPSGTANDWGKSVGIPYHLERCLELFRRQRFVIQDVGCIQPVKSPESRQFFTNIAGLGFDSYVAIRTNRLKSRWRLGRFSYLTELFRSLISYQPVHLTLHFDSDEHQCSLFSFCAGIGRFNGSGMKQLPEAVIDDGLLDVVCIGKMPKHEVLLNIPGVYSGSFIRNRHVKYFKCREITVVTDPPVTIEMDGNPGLETPLKISLIPCSLKVLADPSYQTW